MSYSKSVRKKICALLLCCAVMAAPLPTHANEPGPIKKAIIKRIIEKKMDARNKAKEKGGSDKGFYVKGKGKSRTETLDGREFIVYTPPSLPRKGNTPLLIVLHGGFGNAAHIQNYIGLDPLADDRGFVVAYLNGTQVAKKLPDKFRGWNAGGCCGQPYKREVDDIGFITGVIDLLAQKYGIDKTQVYGTGHSNGGMMTQRILCETDLYKNGVSVSGTLQMDIASCPAASGNVVMNIHGAQDANLPVQGGHTDVGFNKETDYKSQDYAKEVFERSGATYDLLLLEGADHSPETINAVLWKTENMSLPQKIVSYLGI